PGGHGPGDPDRAKGWVNRWLAATVRVTLPVLPKEPAPDKPPVQGGEDFSLPVGKRLGEHLGERFGERLGERLRRTRIHRGFSQAAVAATLQISRGYLSQLENGLRRPSPALHQRILRWLRDTRDTHG